MDAALKGQLQRWAETLHRDARASAVRIYGRGLRLLAAVGEDPDPEPGPETMSAAVRVAAVGGIARLPPENPENFVGRYGAKNHRLHARWIARRVVAFVTFDTRRTTAGLVRLRLKQQAPALVAIVEARPLSFRELPEEELERLLSPYGHLDMW